MMTVNRRAFLGLAAATPMATASHAWLDVRRYGAADELAVERADTHYAILNVSNVREFVLGIDASARMLRDFSSFDPDGFLHDWCERQFGVAASSEAERAYRAYFASYVTDDLANAPQLLDGLTRSAGQEALEDLLSSVSAKRLPKVQGVAELLHLTRQQRERLEDAGTEARKAATDMSAAARRFFEANLLAQHGIIFGLTCWLEASLEAHMSATRGDRAASAAHLTRAAEALATIREAQALATRGSKWTYWYRGDRKMNLKALEDLTGDALQRARHP